MRHRSAERSGLTVFVVIGKLPVFEVDEVLNPQDGALRALPIISCLEKTRAAQSWCSKLSRKRFTAMTLVGQVGRVRPASGVGGESRPATLILRPSGSDPSET
jgi:hypothetical protein